MRRVFAHFASTPSKIPTRYYTTGHSLGGGLAQHVLYSNPDTVNQAFAFDPSSVTGYADQSPATQVSACQCRQDSPDGEARIYRAYDSYEILASLRIVHKTFLPPERHIQEVRFPNSHSHSMKGLAFYLLDNSRTVSPHSDPWFAGKGDHTSNETCTAAFIRQQRNSCNIVVWPEQWNKCPQ